MSLAEQKATVDLVPPLNGRAMEKPEDQNRIVYAMFAVAGCAAAIASVVAAAGRAGLFGGALGLLMAAVAVIDARSFVIPDRLTLAAFTLGLANAASESSGAILEDIADAAARGILLALAFYMLRAAYFRLRRRQGIGLGDVKLAAAAGAWLDWTLIPIAIEIAALTALAGYALRQCFKNSSLEPGAKLPFGLFFAPAIWLCWLAAAVFLKS